MFSDFEPQIAPRSSFLQVVAEAPSRTSTGATVEEPTSGSAAGSAAVAAVAAAAVAAAVAVAVAVAGGRPRRRCCALPQPPTARCDRAVGAAPARRRWLVLLQRTCRLLAPPHGSRVAGVLIQGTPLKGRGRGRGSTRPRGHRTRTSTRAPNALVAGPPRAELETCPSPLPC